MNATVKNIRSFFVGRSDAYGLYPNSIHPNNKPFKKEAPLNDKIIQDHLDQKKTIGIYYAYNIEGMWYCGFCTIDIDLHGETNVKKIKTELGPLTYEVRKGVIEHYNIKPNDILRDFSGEGYHISTKFAKNTTLSRAHDFAEDLKRFLKDKYSLDEEIFPKQALLNDNGYGNFVKLPLSLNRKNGEYCEILDDFDLSKQGEGYKIPDYIPHDVISKQINRVKENKGNSIPIKINVKDANFTHFFDKVKPCFKAIILGKLSTHGKKGRGHYMNITLCNILQYIGASKDIRIKAFENQPEFDYKLTKYYVEKLEKSFKFRHIRGLTCDKIQEKGLCLKFLEGECNNGE